MKKFGSITLFAAAVAVMLVSGFSGIMAEAAYNAPLRFTMTDIDGNEVNLADFKGKVVMIVNVASKCGNTPQYEDLQALYDKYGKDGFVVLGFPANNFGGQEPGTDSEIKSFCTGTYGVTFPVFSKVSVEGEDQCPLFSYLTWEETNPGFSGPIRWNFDKFLVGRDGKVVERFSPKTKPESEEVVTAIKKALAVK